MLLFVISQIGIVHWIFEMVYSVESIGKSGIEKVITTYLQLHTLRFLYKNQLIRITQAQIANFYVVKNYSFKYIKSWGSNLKNILIYVKTGVYCILTLYIWDMCIVRVGKYF